MNLLEILKKNADNAKRYIDGLVSEKQDTLTFDTAPTKGSQNPVTSDGIQKAIAAKTIDLSNYPTKNGTGASGTWGISITGNASTATKLATPRTLALTGKVAGSATFDGSANASINVTSVNADSATNDSNGANITNTYLKKSGGTMTGALNFANATKNIVGDDVAIGDFNRGGTLGVQGESGNSSIMLIKNGAAWSANSEGAIMMYNSSTQSLDFNFQ